MHSTPEPPCASAGLAGRQALALFHPAVQRWFAATFPEPTECQRDAWPAIKAGETALIAAPTGSGKTLAAFLCALDDLVRQDRAGMLVDEVQILYVSPLKALGNDIQKNLDGPLAGISALLEADGDIGLGIRTFVRSGDTPAAARAAMRRRPPHVLVTTPESLYILLTSASGREALRSTRTVIVDEIHAVCASKRGAHLALSLARLDALCARPPVRIGLSATQRPIEAVAAFLGGADGDGVPMACRIVDSGHVRERDLALELPGSPLETVMSHEGWREIYDRLAALAGEHRTTLVFANTRRLTERVARHLAERLGEDAVAAHHGSLSREARLLAEQRLKRGELKVLVATASLELGIDIGDVDLVCQIGSTRAIATFLQRVGRSGHGVGRVPRGRLFPLTRDELVECAALLCAVRAGDLDRLEIPAGALDVLAQQVVATVACEPWEESALHALARRAWPYRDLSVGQFAAVARMLGDGFASRRGRSGAWLHRDTVNGWLRARRGARLAAVTNGGAIPDNAQYEVREEPGETYVGSLDEDFAIESCAGDIFQLGNTSWRILRVESGTVRVEDAHGQPPTIPFWLGEAPARTFELSAALARLRAQFEAAHDAGDEQAVHWLTIEAGVSRAAALQIVEYLGAARAAFGALPTHATLCMERFFDESGGMQLVIHAPFGGRINRAWGLALRKRFCRSFNFELQAAANEDALVLSLGETHSFPLADVWRFLSSASVRDVLVQAVLDAPVFGVRWRWSAACALAIPRFRGGRKVPARLQRMLAEDLAGIVFPDSRACFENLRGEREIPEHPLVEQVLRDCLTEAMDIDGLQRLLARIERGELRLIAKDLNGPSPLAQAILNAAPYTFLDDAPLEERRTLAVQGRRWLDAASAADLGRLDPEAIARVRGEAWPEAGNADEMADALALLGFATAAEVEGANWTVLCEELVRSGRATRYRADVLPAPVWIATERLPQLAAAVPGGRADPVTTVPAEYARVDWDRDLALVELLRGRLEGLGPVTAAALGTPLGLAASAVTAALARLEGEGFALQGRYTQPQGELEWCDRRLLARIHRQTVDRLRREIEPVSAADFMRFLLAWQHVAPDARMEGPQALGAVLEQLQGWAAPASAWESELLPLRVRDYAPARLDEVCLAGRAQWVRAGVARPAPLRSPSVAPVRGTPIAFVHRRSADAWAGADATGEGTFPGAAAAAVATHLRECGASFFDELVDATQLPRTMVENGLGELVARGLARCDSFKGLRALIAPARAQARRRSRFAQEDVGDAGRWSLVRRGGVDASPDAAVESVARALLARYGVVFRRVLEREAPLPPWRDLARVYRRLEARGEIRGGRFVAGPSGEQFALPEAIPALRAARRAGASGALATVSGVDPLNLAGILVPGPRVPALAGNRVLYRDGAALAVLIGGAVTVLQQVPGATEWEIRSALLRRANAPSLAALRGGLRTA